MLKKRCARIGLALAVAMTLAAIPRIALGHAGHGLTTTATSLLFDALFLSNSGCTETAAE